MPSRPMLGVLGVAPSMSKLIEISARERELGTQEYPVRLPDAVGAVPATEGLSDVGLRTLPPREFGGNLDLPYVNRGSKVDLVAEVPGAMLSVGDLHFAQGDGELGGTAIETSGYAVLRCRRSVHGPLPADVIVVASEPHDISQTLIGCLGISVGEAGENYWLNVDVALRPLRGQSG